ncbi:MAG: (Fe-S)-binding protein [Acidimicrobiia bacterium]
MSRTVALFSTCLVDTMFPDVAKSVVVVLERLGHEVVFPEQQSCCGQMHINSGYQHQTIPLIQNYVDAFEPYDLIVAPSASCVGTIRHQQAMVARAEGSPELASRAEAVSARTYEFSELLVDVLGVTDVGATYAETVTYHPTCHSLRMLQIGDNPLTLLREVRKLDLVELSDADQCCGFGGTFSIKNADTSAAMATDKASCVVASGAGACSAVDNSCLMNIGGVLERQGSGVRTVHLAEILASTENDE